MRLILSGRSLEDKETAEWFKRISFDCLGWLEFNPARVPYEEGVVSLSIPVRRVVLSGYTGSSFLRIFRSFVPSRMSYVPGVLTIGNVLGVNAVGRTPAVDKWVTVEPAMANISTHDRPNVIYIGPDPFSLDASSGIEVEIGQLHLEYCDEAEGDGPRQ